MSVVGHVVGDGSIGVSITFGSRRGERFRHGAAASLDDRIYIGEGGSQIEHA
jgi:hypothetical protein